MSTEGLPIEGSVALVTGANRGIGRATVEALLEGGAKMNPSEVAAAILAAVTVGDEDIYPGEMAAGLSAGLVADPKGVEAEFGQMLPG